MTLELFRPETPAPRRTSLVGVPSGAVLAESRIPADRRGRVVVALDGAHDPSAAIESENLVMRFVIVNDGPYQAVKKVLYKNGAHDPSAAIESENLVMRFVIVNDGPYQAVKKVLYKNGSSGSFKNTKALKELVP
ncbi:MAG: hypothetical protein L6R28_02165 [Planctomycetes bacterium]|nr:hypothetical protein [Planctomycetota bacterium]